MAPVEETQGSASRSHRRRAGGSAHERFEFLLGKWRRRKGPAIAAVFPLLIAPCVVMALVGSGPWDVAGIFMAGAWTGMAMWIWNSPPEHIERLRRGAEGERRTARELRRLDPGHWTTAHDIGTRFGNWDHVVVGPGGVFLLDSKNLLGDASVEGGCVVVRRAESPDEHWRFDRLPARMRAAAAQLSSELRQAHRVWVTPVVVVWPELVDQAVEAGGIVYVSGPHVAAWLAAREKELIPSDRAAIARRLVEVAESSPSSAGGDWFGTRTAQQRTP